MLYQILKESVIYYPIFLNPKDAYPFISIFMLRELLLVSMLQKHALLEIVQAQILCQ